MKSNKSVRWQIGVIYFTGSHCLAIRSNPIGVIATGRIIWPAAGGIALCGLPRVILAGHRWHCQVLSCTGLAIGDMSGSTISYHIIL